MSPSVRALPRLKRNDAGLQRAGLRRGLIELGASRDDHMRTAFALELD